MCSPPRPLISSPLPAGHWRKNGLGRFHLAAPVPSLADLAHVSARTRSWPVPGPLVLSSSFDDEGYVDGQRPGSSCSARNEAMTSPMSTSAGLVSAWSTPHPRAASGSGAAHRGRGQDHRQPGGGSTAAPEAAVLSLRLHRPDNGRFACGGFIPVTSREPNDSARGSELRVPQAPRPLSVIRTVQPHWRLQGTGLHRHRGPHDGHRAAHDTSSSAHAVPPRSCAGRVPRHDRDLC